MSHKMGSSNREVLFMQILFSENIVFTKLISIVMAFAELLICRLFFIKAFNLFGLFIIM